jgi:bifunctional N-acetylglucosamine-1-phosphate-uridyltransferase/glucosamine-1-phosphate-acetyltransferase GlmU-like protein
MEGITKPFYKPMLEINGIPLLRYAVEYASSAGCEKAVVVVSPHNVDYVHSTLEQYSRWVELATQDEPLGPGHAALIGMSRVESQKTMLLMSDNIMDGSIVADMATNAAITGVNAVGVRRVPLSEAARFTRVRRGARSRYMYVEGVEVGDDDLWPDYGMATVWCGPLIYDTATAVRVLSRELSRSDGSSELKLGPYLTEILCGPTVLVDVHAMDVGIPAVYEQAKNGAL